MPNINQYMGPVQTQYMQTYVDQYVPLPFETMQKTIEAKDALQERNMQNVDALQAMLNINARSGQEGQRDDLVKQDYDKITAIVDQYNGDLTQSTHDIHRLARDIQQSKTSGAYGAIESNYKDWLTYKEKVKDKIKTGVDKGGYDERRGQYAIAAEQATFDNSLVGKEGYLGLGSHNDPRVAAQHTWTKELNNQLEKVKTMTYVDQVNYFKGNAATEGFIRKVDTKGKRITEQELKDLTALYLRSDPRYADDLNSAMGYMTQDEINRFYGEEALGNIEAKTFRQNEIDTNETTFKDQAFEAAGGWNKYKPNLDPNLATVEVKQDAIDKNFTFSPYNVLGKTLQGMSINGKSNMTEQQAIQYSNNLFAGYESDGKGGKKGRIVNVNGKDVDMTTLSETQRLKLFVDGKVKLPSNLTDNQKENMMSQIKSSLQVKEDLEDAEKTFMTQAMNELTPRETAIYSSLEKTYGGAAQTLGFKNAADFITNGKSIILKEGKLVKPKYNSKVSSSALDIEYIPYSSDIEKITAFNKLNNNNVIESGSFIDKKLASKIETYKEQQHKTLNKTFTSLPNLEALPEDFNIYNQTNSDFNKKQQNTRNILLEFYDKEGRNQVGLDANGNKVFVSDITYEQNAKKEWVKSDKALGILFDSKNNQVRLKGRDSEGKEVYLDMPRNKIEARFSTVNGEIDALKPKSFLKKAATLVDGILSTSTSTEIRLNNRVSTLPDGLRLRAENPQDSDASTTSHSNDVFLYYTEGGQNKQYKINPKEINHIIAVAMKLEQDIDDSEGTFDQKTAAKVKVRDEVQAELNKFKK